ncbi:MAG: 50S ribosomal protein L13 [Euryarchaeota archaeon RBG_13_57_23]|nr:MAG: 50S ribosomal protein L13 [Euryarchaeota archaeon RBG_13_57_23]
MAIVINAEGLILGRLCTHVAKKIRNGDEVVILNAEKAVISGRREQLQQFYLHRRHRASSQSKAKGPKYPRTPDRILKRTVRGMIEYRKPWGKAAYRRLKVYIGVPKEFKDVKAETIETAKKPHLDKYVLLGEITNYLGAKEV